MTSGEKNDLHQLAAEGNERELARALEQKPEDIDSYRPRKELENVIVRHGLKGTPLHIAIVCEVAPCVSLLFDKGADPHLLVIQSERGDEPVEYADAEFLARKITNDAIIAMLAQV